jgi:purine-binding chemotaxis protein CheW
MNLNSAKRVRPPAQRSLVAFMVGPVRYAIDIAQVKEIVSPLSLTRLPHTPEGLAGVADHRDEVVPIIDLRSRFDLPTAASRKVKWILVAVSERTVGLVVDDVLGVLRIAATDFRAAPDLGGGEHARGIAAVTNHGGELVFVLDLTRFEKLADSLDEMRALTTSSALRAKKDRP